MGTKMQPTWEAVARPCVAPRYAKAEGPSDGRPATRPRPDPTLEEHQRCSCTPPPSSPAAPHSGKHPSPTTLVFFSQHQPLARKGVCLSLIRGPFSGRHHGSHLAHDPVAHVRRPRTPRPRSNWHSPTRATKNRSSSSSSSFFGGAVSSQVSRSFFLPLHHPSCNAASVPKPTKPTRGWRKEGTNS